MLRVIIPTSEKSYIIIWFCYSQQILSSGRDRGVVITGCDTGFGNQLAKRLHSFDFVVFACCLNNCSDGAMALKKLGAESGRLHVLQMDVTCQNEVDAARNYVERNLPHLGLWGLVNNAGIAFIGYVEWLPLAHYEKVILKSWMIFFIT